MKMSKICLAGVLCCMTIMLSGCFLLLLGAAGAAGAGTVAYVRGELKATLDANMDRSYDASLKALDQLQLIPISKQKDQLGAEIVARTSVDKRVTVTLKRVDDKLTNLSIRIGVFGDESLSRTIYDRIKKSL
jgi:hypothetical protein